MICLHLSLSFKSLSIPFIVNHIYCHYKYTNDQRSSIIFICRRYIPTHIFFSLVCCCILSSFFASSLSTHTDIDTTLKNHRHSSVSNLMYLSSIDTEFFLLSRCLASISRTPMSSVRYTIVSLILTSRQHQHARSYISSTPSSF